MRKIYLSVLSIIALIFTAKAQLVLTSQFINPCGGDEHNEFIVAKTTSLPINIADISLGSYKPAVSGNSNDYNYWWRGNNVVASPYPLFSSFPGESCASGLHCYGFRYPSVPADNADINTLINQLNTVAGCNVFIAVPTTDIIPANSNVIIFVGAGYRSSTALCGFDDAASNLNFSNHCNAGVATNTYYVVFGNADGAGTDCSNTGSGYFSNTARRVSTLHILNAGGDSTVLSDYTTSEQDYTPGSKDSTSVSAGIIVPDGNGGTTWVNNKGCIPTPDVILAVKLTYFKGVLSDKKVTLNWLSDFEQDIKSYIVEKSVNGRNFSPIASLQPANISGSSYSSTDVNLVTGFNFYRLKVVNLNGTIEYSAVIKFNFNRSSDNLYVSPNPSEGSAAILYQSTNAKNAVLMVTDIAGKLISKKTIALSAGTNSFAIGSERLSSGMYIIQVVSNGQAEKIFFIKK